MPASPHQAATATSPAALVPLGRTGLLVSRVGLGSSYGLAERDVEHAFAEGINWFYWGTLRRAPFGRAVTRLAATHRERMVVVVQSYARFGLPLRWSTERALKALRLDHADLLLLGLWNAPPPPRIMDAALDLVRRGRVRHLMLSCHRRAAFAEHFRDERIAAFMLRYNASHPGAEEDVFPFLPAAPAPSPGVIAYTATCWGRLPDPKLTPAGERTPRGSDCYRFALSHEAVTLCLAGPANAAQLDDALVALRSAPLTPDELAWMKRVGAAVRVSAPPPSQVIRPWTRMREP